MIVVHGHTPAVNDLIRDTEVVEKNCMLDKTQYRINLDVGSSPNCPQIAMAEFLRSNYRIHIFKDHASLRH